MKIIVMQLKVKELLEAKRETWNRSFSGKFRESMLFQPCSLWYFVMATLRKLIQCLEYMDLVNMPHQVMGELC